MARKDPDDQARGYVKAAIISLEIAQRVLPAKSPHRGSLEKLTTDLAEWLV